MRGSINKRQRMKTRASLMLCRNHKSIYRLMQKHKKISPLKAVGMCRNLYGYNVLFAMIDEIHLYGKED